MIDIPHLRAVHPIMFVSEYLRLRGISGDVENSKGNWGGSDYHRGQQPSTHIVSYRDYDPEEIVRVDNYDLEPWTTTDTLALRANEVLRTRLEQLKKPQMSLAEAHATISSIKKIPDPEELMALLKEAGWEILHTWDGALGMDFVKWVVKPQIDVAPRENLRGFVQEYGPRTEEVLHLNGEIHLYRKPGSMRFTTMERAHQFASLVLHDMLATHAVQTLAARLVHRIDSLTGGRLWVAAQ